MDICDGSSVEIVDEFCYLGDMLSVNGDVDCCDCQDSQWLVQT